MSEMETHKGKLIPKHFDGFTFEDQCKNACSHYGFELDSYHKNWQDCLNDEGYRKVHIDDEAEVIYEIQDTELDSYGFVEGSKNADGSIDYFISWYNGGGSMSEVLDSLIEGLDKK